MTKKKWMTGISTLLLMVVIVIGVIWISGSSSGKATTTEDFEEETSKRDVKKEGKIQVGISNESLEESEDEESKNKEEKSRNKKAEEEKKESAVENKKPSKEVKDEEKEKETAETKTPESKKEDKPTAPTTKVIDPVTKYVDVSSLNVRSGPGTNYKVITSVTDGQSVTITEISSTWGKVKVNGKTGWLSRNYLSDKKPVVAKKEGKQEEPKQTPVEETPTPKNDADKLTTVSGNNQLILVTTDSYGSTSATIQTFEKDGSGKWNRVMNTSGFLGKNGFGKQKEGDGKTPIGKYSIGTAFGQNGNPGTKLPWRDITSDDVWVDDSDSALYNTWQSKSKTQGQWKSAENMTHRLYTYGFVINYNTQRTPGKGSAIFFHTGSSYTLGCVATSQSNVISILKWLDPAKNPVIIMTPSQNLSNY
ncbi:SH3 domain-containing protein [Oceanobacillus kapialis]|uniref:SH3 domain-containing protein n=1 Tax=Oceanobacillus kapialis TaxID=481353 RepID=A0ABW5Q4Q8_9BACI